MVSCIHQNIIPLLDINTGNEIESVIKEANMNPTYDDTIILADLIRQEEV